MEFTKGKYSLPWLGEECEKKKDERETQKFEAKDFAQW
jgi:hypothetical protein